MAFTLFIQNFYQEAKAFNAGADKLKMLVKYSLESDQLKRRRRTGGGVPLTPRSEGSKPSVSKAGKLPPPKSAPPKSAPPKSAPPGGQKTPSQTPTGSPRKPDRATRPPGSTESARKRALSPSEKPCPLSFKKK